MEITRTQHQCCDLYKVTGRIDSYTAPNVAEALAQSTNDGRYKLVLDLSSVDYISSAGLRVMLSAQKTCKQSGKGELVLSGVTRRVLDTLEIAGFVPLFKFFNDAEASIARFNTPEKAGNAT